VRVPWDLPGQAGRTWAAHLARALFATCDLHLEPVTAEDAERAAASWAPGTGLSLADRLCPALGERLGGVALTADGAWGVGAGIRQIR
jgi:PIN domain nuclease of toxin-antitoxin system